MEPEEYAKMRRLEDSYWWFVGRRALVSSLLETYPPRGTDFLDIGCGGGILAEPLAKTPGIVLPSRPAAEQFVASSIQFRLPAFSEGAIQHLVAMIGAHGN